MADSKQTYLVFSGVKAEGSATDTFFEADTGEDTNGVVIGSDDLAQFKQTAASAQTLTMRVMQNADCVIDLENAYEAQRIGNGAGLPVYAQRVTGDKKRIYAGLGVMTKKPNDSKDASVSNADIFEYVFTGQFTITTISI